MTKREMKTYRALKACVAGGSFRRPGEIFAAPAYDRPPAHLEEVAAETDLSTPAPADAVQSAAKAVARKPAGKARAVTAAQGPGLAEIGGQSKPLSSAEVTSADLIRE